MILLNNSTKVLILTHYAIRTNEGEDTDQRLRHYLLNKVQKIVHITHPLHDFNNQISYLHIFNNGKLVKEEQYHLPKAPFWISYLLHPLLNYFWLFKYGFNYDLCIAMEDLSFITIYPLRIIKLIRRLIYYTIDFVPVRFSNKTIDGLYHSIDKFACTKSDAYWAMTYEMRNGRKIFGVDLKNIRQFTKVPIGYETHKIKLKPLNKINYHNIIYMGALRESTGIELVVKSLPLIIKKISDVKLTIIGHGDLKDHLIDLTKKLNIVRNVNFLGYVDNFWDLTKIMASHSLGLAPYPPLKNSYTRYSDPSKIKLMMACGLPVITTDITTMTKQIRNSNLGILINYSEAEFSKAVCSLLSNRSRYQKMREAVIRAIPTFDINYILDNAINRLI